MTRPRSSSGTTTPRRSCRRWTTTIYSTRMVDKNGKVLYRLFGTGLGGGQVLGTGNPTDGRPAIPDEDYGTYADLSLGVKVRILKTRTRTSRSGSTSVRATRTPHPRRSPIGRPRPRPNRRPWRRRPPPRKLPPRRTVADRNHSTGGSLFGVSRRSAFPVLYDLEPALAPDRLFADLDAANVGLGRSVAGPVDQLPNGVRLTFEDRLDGSVVGVGHPARDAASARLAPAGVAEEHPLHPTPNQHPTANHDTEVCPNRRSRPTFPADAPPIDGADRKGGA